MLNNQIDKYTKLVQQGEIVSAYKAILKFMAELRVYFNEGNPTWKIASLYQGYMDVSYFAITTNKLREKHIKVVIIYVHDKNRFEIWLSAQNMKYIEEHRALISIKEDSNIKLFHNKDNSYGIIESIIVENPNFESKEYLKKTILKGTEAFIDIVEKSLQSL